MSDWLDEPGAKPYPPVPDLADVTTVRWSIQAKELDHWVGVGDRQTMREAIERADAIKAKFPTRSVRVIEVRMRRTFLTVHEV